MTLLSTKMRDRFFVLRKNDQFEEFFTIEDAINCPDRSIVIIDRFKEFFTPHGGYDWRTSNFTFIENGEQPVNLSCNSWTIHGIDTTYKSSSRTDFDIVLSDPFRKIRRIRCELNLARGSEDNNSHDRMLIQIALAKLNEHSKFHSWEQIDLEAENDRLRKRIEKLENEIIDLIANSTK